LFYRVLLLPFVTKLYQLKYRSVIVVVGGFLVIYSLVLLLYQYI